MLFVKSKIEWLNNIRTQNKFYYQIFYSFILQNKNEKILLYLQYKPYN